MNLILKANVRKLGSIGDIVGTSIGYGKYLLLNGLACYNTKENVEEINKRRAELELAAEKKKDHHMEIVNKINSVNCFIILKQASRSGQLYGSVSSKEIASVISEKIEMQLDSRYIKTDSIKSIGEYDIAVMLDCDVETKFKLSIRDINSNEIQQERSEKIDFENFEMQKEERKEE